MQAFEKAPPDIQEILTKPIKELGLKLEGSHLERYVQRLYRELERKGLKKFRPLCYLTDEWGCPSGEPVIGIPFYLADPKLARLEKEMNDLEDEREILMYLRHEAGHAFNYTYELYKTPEWRDLFGPFRRPYRDNYRPIPFSRRYVRHIAGWYAQKHPDEDFAETFAVWLTPRSQWRKKYKGWPALAKLRYVDRMAHRLRDAEPLRRTGHTDLTVDEMETTVADFYQAALAEAAGAGGARARHGPDRHLQVLAPPQEGRPPGGQPARREPQDDRGQGRVLDRRAASRDQGARRVGRRACPGARALRRHAPREGAHRRGDGVHDRPGDELRHAREVRAAMREGTA